MQKVKVQDGVIKYVTTDPTLFVDFSIIGQANVSRQLNVGDDPFAAGNITTPTGIDLNIIPGTGGDLSLAAAGAGLLKFNNATWPSGVLAPNTGMYIGASALNTLEYYPFTLDFTANDALTVPQLNAAYPTIQPGQRVVGPTVIYECVAPATWRIMGGGGSGPLPVNPTEVVFGDTTPGDVISSPDLVFNSGTSTLTVGSGIPGLISAGVGQTLEIESDVSVSIKTNSTTRITVNSAGAILVGGNAGTAGQVLTSAGAAAVPTWSTIAGGTADAFVMTLDSSSPMDFSGSAFSGPWTPVTRQATTFAHWDVPTNRIIFDEVGSYMITCMFRLVPTNPSGWPSRMSVFGAYGIPSGALNIIGPNRSLHTVNNGNGYPEDLQVIAAFTPLGATAYDVCETDQFTVSAQVGGEFIPTLYGGSYLSGSDTFDISMVLTIQKVGTTFI